MSTSTITHASESQHWYWRDGKPAYEVPSADGKRMISPDVRHARKLSLVPGFSSVAACASKPALENWKIDQALMSALTLPRNEGETLDDFMVRAKEDSKQQAIQAAEKGTEIHAQIQKHYEGAAVSDDYLSIVKPVSEAIYNQWGQAGWSTELSFSHPMGYGGKIDLYGHATRWKLIDVKTKAFDVLPTRENKIQLAWDEHAMQLAAYRAGMDDGTADCANVFVSTSKPGLVYIHEWSEEDLAHGWTMFKGLLAYWKAKNRYDGAY